LPLSCEVVQKGGFGPRFVGEGDTPDFGLAFTNRSQLLPSMWPILVEFRSASSEIRWRKKKKE